MSSPQGPNDSGKRRELQAGANPASPQHQSQAAKTPPTNLRLLVALGLMPLGVLAVVLDGPVRFALVSLAAAAMIYEWVRQLAPARWARPALIYSVSIGFALVSAGGGALQAACYALIAGGLTAWGWALASGRTPHQLLAGAGVIYVGFPCVVFICWEIGFTRTSLELLALMCAVWAADTGAYLAGSRLGRLRLWPALSPDKTWEGLIGGLFAAATVSGCFFFCCRIGHYCH